MRSRIHIALVADRVDAFRRAPSLALAAVDPMRILAVDYAAATRRFARLSDSDAAALCLTRRDAENLLAACDAVFIALDDGRIDTAELADAVQAFRTFRTLVHHACSHPPASQSRVEEAA